MLTKITINGVTITSTYAHKDEHSQGADTTNLHIDNISIEDEATAEETVEVVKAFADIAKTVKPRKRNNRKRYHVVKTKDYPNNGNNILWYVWDRHANQHYIKVGHTTSDIDIMTAGYFKQCITEHNAGGRIIAEYDCNNFRL